jgi:mannonate dehydratase
MMFPGDKPGLGVEIDEGVATQFPYRSAYLPINRKLDGTMHNW